MAVKTFGKEWYQGLSPLARKTVDAWFASYGISAQTSKQIQITDGESGCTVLVYPMSNGHRGPDVAERAFPDRPAVLR